MCKAKRVPDARCLSVVDQIVAMQAAEVLDQIAVMSRSVVWWCDVALRGVVVWCRAAPCGGVVSCGVMWWCGGEAVETNGGL